MTPISHALPADPPPWRTSARSPAVEVTCGAEEGVVFMGVAFRGLPGGRSRWRLPQSRDRGRQGSTHCGYCVHGSHLLPMDHDRRNDSTPATRCATGIKSGESLRWRQGATGRVVAVEARQAGKVDAGVGPGPGEADHLTVTGGGGGAAVGGDTDGEAGGVRLDHLAAADDQADVARVGRRCRRSRRRTPGRPARPGWPGPRAPATTDPGRARDVDAGGEVGHHHQAGAVEGVRAGATPQVRLADLLLGVGDGGRTRPGWARRRGPLHRPVRQRTRACWWRRCRPPADRVAAAGVGWRSSRPPGRRTAGGCRRRSRCEALVEHAVPEQVLGRPGDRVGRIVDAGHPSPSSSVATPLTFSVAGWTGAPPQVLPAAPPMPICIGPAAPKALSSRCARRAGSSAVVALHRADPGQDDPGHAVLRARPSGTRPGSWTGWSSWRRC